MQKNYVIAVIGASGSVGAQILNLLEERGFPVKEVRAFRSSVDEADSIEFNEQTLPLERLCPPRLAGVDIAFFCTPESVSLVNAPEIVTISGGVAIDLSRAFRKDPLIPLVVPELNKKDLELAFRGPAKHIVSLPNALATAVGVSVAPLLSEAKLERILITSYQSASSVGKRGIDELHKQVVSILNAQSTDDESIFSPQAAFNVLPVVPPQATLDADGYTPQEKEIAHSLQRVLHSPNLSISVTSTIVPTFIGEAAAVHLDFSQEIDLKKAKEALRQAPSVMLTEELEEPKLPMPIYATGEDSVLVGRVRKSGPCSLWLWISYDNVRKGAALSAVQVAEIIVRDHAGALDKRHV